MSGGTRGDAFTPCRDSCGSNPPDRSPPQTGPKPLGDSIWHDSCEAEQHLLHPLNERQRLVINKLLEGFDGKLTTSKWSAMTKSSNDTALRDIQQLVERGVLVRNPAGGRSTSYSLAGL